ncbi:hypothetical protein, partial [Streptomyces antimicrobicus]
PVPRAVLDAVGRRAPVTLAELRSDRKLTGSLREFQRAHDRAVPGMADRRTDRLALPAHLLALLLSVFLAGQAAEAAQLHPHGLLQGFAAVCLFVAGWLLLATLLVGASVRLWPGRRDRFAQGCRELEHPAPAALDPAGRAALGRLSTVRPPAVRSRCR